VKNPNLIIFRIDDDQLAALDKEIASYGVPSNLAPSRHEVAREMMVIGLAARKTKRKPKR
jgi:hypothetical protein